MFDIETGVCVYQMRISNETLFVTAEHPSMGGFLGINRSGQVLAVGIDENAIVSYLKTHLQVRGL